MIRAATIEDRFALVAMGRAFHGAAGSGVAFDAAAAERTIKACIASPDGLALVAGEPPVGMLLAAVAVHPFTGGKVAHEVALWIEPAARGGRLVLGLLDAYEAWAEERGASLIGLADYTGRAGRLYERRGYLPAEMHYARFV